SGADILKTGLAEEPLDAELLQQGWRIVEKNQGKIYDLVMDMLSFSKEREPAVEEVDVNGVVRDVLELLRGRAQGRGVKVVTQLGLAVSRKILREHGGDVYVRTEPGKSSRFFLRLPVRSPFAPDPGTGSGPEMPPLNS